MCPLPRPRKLHSEHDPPPSPIARAGHASFGARPPLVQHQCLAALAEPRWRLSQQSACPAVPSPQDLQHAPASYAAAVVLGRARLLHPGGHQQLLGSFTPVRAPMCEVSRLPEEAVQNAQLPVDPDTCPGHVSHIGIDACDVGSGLWLPRQVTNAAGHSCARQLPRAGLQVGCGAWPVALGGGGGGAGAVHSVGGCV